MIYDDSNPNEVNNEFEVLTWTYCGKHGGQSEIQDEFGFATWKKAYKKYLSIHVPNGGKMIMQYKSNEPDAEGAIRIEEWAE